MEKNCVFCGKEPEEKNKEHILSRWLIEMTGDPRRNAHFGFDFEQMRNSEYSFQQFVFPACKACNEVRSDWESRVKNIFVDLIANKSLTIKKIDMLMDWFDKVRIGLWLGYYQLNRNIAGIEPRLSINNRMGKKDRLLVIYKGEKSPKKLIAVGGNTLAFQYTPSCFMLRVNEYVFFNFSLDYLLAKRVGFPFPTDEIAVPGGGGMPTDFQQGKHTVRFPLLSTPPPAGGVEIYLPIFNYPTEFSSKLYPLYDTPYIRSRMLDCEKQKGAIFIKKGKRYQPYTDPDQLIPLKLFPKGEHPQLTYKLALYTMEWQRELAKTFTHSNMTLLPYKERQIRLEQKEGSLRELNKLISLLRQQM